MKSNPLKKDPDWKEGIQYVFIYIKKYEKYRGQKYKYKQQK